MSTARWMMVGWMFAMSVAAQAQTCREPGESERPVDEVALGGRLYDNWWKTCGLAAPTTAHPAYPAQGRVGVADTWRCKECHGWDYRGRDGAYARGSHATGILGIRAYAGRKEDEIVSVLVNATHGFDQVLSAELLRQLARFVAQGQIDATDRIDGATKRVQGRVSVGQRLYARQCVACHGVQGRRLNFSDKPDQPEFVGTVAVNNPWEMLHKLRNGQPGSVMDRQHLQAKDPDAADRHARMMREHMLAGRAMPSWRTVLSPSEQFDLLAFLQTLPVK